MKQPRSCGFLIVKGDPIESFLLMKHPARWDLPKGHVDPGETDMQCALRELEEETGISAEDVEVDPDFCYETRYMVKARRYTNEEGEVEKTMLIYLGRLLRDVEIEVTEHGDYQWFDWSPPHQIQERAIDPLLSAVASYVGQTDS